MERIIPDFNKSICNPMMGYKNQKTPEIYLEKIGIFERKVENKFLELLRLVDINGSVKTNPSSLPFNHEIVVSLRGESWMNGPYEYKRVFKIILKELLEKGISKFRFYFHINIITDPVQNTENSLIESWGLVEYRFRYHIPVDSKESE